MWNKDYAIYMENQDIRWQQRFQNYDKVLQLLEEGLQIAQPDRTQRAGIVQFFEMGVELAWKLAKYFLESQGFADVKSPRSALKKAFEVGFISDGHTWMDLLSDRNLTTHTYDEEKAVELDALIREKYFPVMKDLHTYFKMQMHR